MIEKKTAGVLDSGERFERTERCDDQGRPILVMTVTYDEGEGGPTVGGWPAPAPLIPTE